MKTYADQIDDILKRPQIKGIRNRRAFMTRVVSVAKERDGCQDVPCVPRRSVVAVDVGSALIYLYVFM